MFRCRDDDIIWWHLSHALHFLLDPMAFISGTQRDTACPLALTWLKPGHILALTFTGPSHSSASELISIFWMMSLRRLCCFSSMLDISFILEMKTLVHVGHVVDTSKWSHVTMLKIQCVFSTRGRSSIKKYLYFLHSLVHYALTNVSCSTLHRNAHYLFYLVSIMSTSIVLTLMNPLLMSIMSCTLPGLLLSELILYHWAALWFGLQTTPDFICLLFTRK